jgi:hypothetical protein
MERDGSLPLPAGLEHKIEDWAAGASKLWARYGSSTAFEDVRASIIGADFDVVRGVNLELTAQVARLGEAAPGPTCY